jgi:hypothetical protein
MDTYRKKQNLYDFLNPKGDIHIIVSGFSDQQIISIDDVTAAVDALPSHHLGGVQEIRYQEDHTYINKYGEETLTTPESCKAAFVQDDQVVLMHHFVSHEEFLHILYHEIGHHVFYRIINGFQRKHWVTEIHPNSKVITKYAGLNASEDFAESYARFVLDPKQLNRLTKKYRFMRDEIFGGISVKLDKNHVDISI